MTGSITGDIIGSIYEFNNIKTKEFNLLDSRCRFTDDTVLTVATSDCLLHGHDYGWAYQSYSRMYPEMSYGGNFRSWIYNNKRRPYNSFGNGSAMRVSPIGFYAKSIEQALELAKRSAEVTHNHPEGIKGAQATATCVFLAKVGKDKEHIRDYVSENFGYAMDRTVDDIRPHYHFNETCQETVPEAIMAFLDSTDFEDAIRNAISLGGDSDTLACITGGIAQAFYGNIPSEIVEFVYEKVDDHFKFIIDKFNKEVGI